MPKKSAGKIKKIFILDTNVILHDSKSIYQFDEHDIVIPIVVLEELDRFKRGNETINQNARKFSRDLDRISGESLFNGGVEISPGKGKISITLIENEQDTLRRIGLSLDEADNRILNCAIAVQKREASRQSGKEIILVTKDSNLRLKAKALGIKAQDYITDQVRNIETLYSGIRIVSDVPSSFIDDLYQNSGGVKYFAKFLDEPPIANEAFILKSGSKSALAIFNPRKNTMELVKKHMCSGIIAKNTEQLFALRVLLNDSIRLVTLTGKAGTGKTLLALAAALERRKKYRQIFLSRPIVPLSNKDIGYLPGDIESKISPYTMPLFDSLAVIKDALSEEEKEKIQEMRENRKINIEPLSFIRGRSLLKVFFIVDEAQNLTPHEVKTIITRAGEGTKVVLTGDIFQIDHPYLDSKSNGLSNVIRKMKGQKLYAHINLEKGERSELSKLAGDLL